MLNILDFYIVEEDLKERKYGSIEITEGEANIKIIEGGEDFKSFLETEALEKGVLLLNSDQRIMPKDGKPFVARLLMRYCGSRFWAHLRE